MVDAVRRHVDRRVELAPGERVLQRREADRGCRSCRKIRRHGCARHRPRRPARRHRSCRTAWHAPAAIQPVPSIKRRIVSCLSECLVFSERDHPAARVDVLPCLSRPMAINDPSRPALSLPPSALRAGDAPDHVADVVGHQQRCRRARARRRPGGRRTSRSSGDRKPVRMSRGRAGRAAVGEGHEDHLVAAERAAVPRAVLADRHALRKAGQRAGREASRGRARRCGRRARSPA